MVQHGLPDLCLAFVTSPHPEMSIVVSYVRLTAMNHTNDISNRLIRTNSDLLKLNKFLELSLRDDNVASFKAL